MNKKSLALTIFLFALILRITAYAFYQPYPHGSAASYASAALGLINGKGLTVSERETQNIQENLIERKSGAYTTFYSPGSDRKPLTEFLPGPAIALAFLWKITHVYNFLPLIILQIIIDSGLIVCFFIFAGRIPKKILYATTLFLLCNPLGIKRVIMPGYDFWPQAFVLSSFALGLLVMAEENQAKVRRSFFAGIFHGLIAWCRSLTVFMPFFVALGICAVNNDDRKQKIRIIVAYSIPIIIALVLLCGYRYQMTGNARPTRSTFWHSFWAGVGQFDNPYHIISEDADIAEKMTQRHPALEYADNAWNNPDSVYERTLRKEAYFFVRTHPMLFMRNTVFRTMMLISPVYYEQGKIEWGKFSLIRKMAGFFLLLLWVEGMRGVFLSDKKLFILMLCLYSYFFIFFSWFYVVGRVILPILFMNVLVYLYGIREIWVLLTNRMKTE